MVTAGVGTSTLAAWRATTAGAALAPPPAIHKLHARGRCRRQLRRMEPPHDVQAELAPRGAARGFDAGVQRGGAVRRPRHHHHAQASTPLVRCVPLCTLYPSCSLVRSVSKQGSYISCCITGRGVVWCGWVGGWMGGRAGGWVAIGNRAREGCDWQALGRMLRGSIAQRHGAPVERTAPVERRPAATPGLATMLSVQGASLRLHPSLGRSAPPWVIESSSLSDTLQNKTCTDVLLPASLLLGPPYSTKCATKFISLWRSLLPKPIGPRKARRRTEAADRKRRAHTEPGEGLEQRG